MKHIHERSFTLSRNNIFRVLALSFMLYSCKKTTYLEIDAADRPPLSSKLSFVNARPANTGLEFWNFIAKVTKEPVAVNTASPYLDGQYGNVQINVTEGTNTSYLISRSFGNSAVFSATGGPNGPIATFYHTVFAAKALNGIKDTLILYYDDLTAPAQGKAKIRFVHLAPGLGSLNVARSSGPGAILFPDVQYGAAGNQALSGDGLSAWSLGPFVNVDAGPADFIIKSSETESEIVFEQNNIAGLVLQEGKIYTFFLNGIAGEPGKYGAYVITHQQE